MTSMLVIVVLGATLAWLNRPDTDHQGPATAVPLDLWADFEAATGILGATITGHTTVGGLHVGAVGFVDCRAARQDPDGTLFLDAAAVVYPIRGDGRLTLRRDSGGYHLQRHRAPVEVAAPETIRRTSARVRVDSRFD